MYFAPNNTRLPIELYCIRACAVVETAAERANLLAAWRQCLINGPSIPSRPIKKQRKLQPVSKECMGVPVNTVESLELALSL